MERLETLNVEKRLTEERLTPLEPILSNSNQKEVTFELVKEVLTNFTSSYKQALTTEQKKQLLQLLIKQIKIDENRKVESIQIHFNNDVVRHFTNKGEDKSSDGDLSSPFSIYFEI